MILHEVGFVLCNINFAELLANSYLRVIGQKVCVTNPNKLENL